MIGETMSDVSNTIPNWKIESLIHYVGRGQWEKEEDQLIMLYRPPANEQSLDKEAKKETLISIFTTKPSPSLSG